MGCVIHKLIKIKNKKYVVATNKHLIYISIYKNKKFWEISQNICLKLVQRSSSTTKTDSSIQECKKITDLVS